MFSPEFVNFTQAIFGNTTTRKEIDTIVDFYRGLLARLPDNAGFAFWVQQFRTAQCQGAAAVTAQAEAISSAYALSGEYAARNRNNAQYVGDLYNAFLRRGGDLAGVQFWIGQVATGAQTREQVRKAFVASPEFSARVQAIIAQGCLP
jgi:serralysin